MQTYYYYFPASSDNCPDGYKQCFIVTFVWLKLGERLLAIRLRAGKQFIVFVSGIFASDDESNIKLLWGEIYSWVEAEPKAYISLVSF